MVEFTGYSYKVVVPIHIGLNFVCWFASQFRGTHLQKPEHLLDTHAKNNQNCFCCRCYQNHNECMISSCSLVQYSAALNSVLLFTSDSDSDFRLIHNYCEIDISYGFLLFGFPFKIRIISSDLLSGTNPISRHRYTLIKHHLFSDAFSQKIIRHFISHFNCNESWICIIDVYVICLQNTAETRKIYIGKPIFSN